MLEWLALVPLFLATPQASCASVDALKAKVYTFRPSALSETTRAAKAREMDEFWNLVRSRKDGSTCLQQLLVNEKDDAFFLFDGAELLANLDQGAPATPIVVTSVRRAPIAEIDAGAYVSLAIRLARGGADISTLAERFLEHPAEQVSVPAHALNIHRTFGALLLFGILPAERADVVLTTALESGQPRVRETAATLLSLLMTEGGLKALKQSPRVGELSADVRTAIERTRSLSGYKLPPGAPAFTREQVLEHLRLLPRTEAEYAAAQAREAKYQAQLPSSAPVETLFRHMAEGPPFTSIAGHSRFNLSAAATLTAADLPTLREWRRQSVRGLSDETLGDFMTFTAIVNSVISRLGLYAEYRQFPRNNWN